MTMPEAERQQMARKHIFAVNGSAEFLDFIRELFQEEGYNVTTTNYVPRTFDQVAALQPDMLIVDLAIGVQAGWALLEQLQAEAVTHDIPVIVTTTGGPDLLTRAQAQQQRYGGQRFVAKPFDLEELLTTVRELIGTATED
jgi:chemosensory pili system protein ChpA (sensor histidine kinase/response regulator)